MKKRVMDVQYMGDPALIPIRNSEVTFLVRFFHVVATKINEMVSTSSSHTFVKYFLL